MEPPKDVKVYETVSSHYWFDSDGILCSKSKKDAPRLTREDLEKQVNDFKALHRNRGDKFCMIIDAEYTKPTNKRERDDTERLLNQITKAMAVIIYNPMGKMLVNLFLGLKPPKYPMKMFGPKEVDKAREWLRQYL